MDPNSAFLKKRVIRAQTQQFLMLDLVNYWIPDPEALFEGVAYSFIVTHKMKKTTFRQNQSIIILLVPKILNHPVR